MLRGCAAAEDSLSGNNQTCKTSSDLSPAEAVGLIYAMCKSWTLIKASPGYAYWGKKKTKNILFIFIIQPAVVS